MAFPDVANAVEPLRQQVVGTVLTPNDEGYDKARSGFSLTLDQRPALIVIANDAQDAVAAVRFAAQNGLGVSIQSTGHGIQYPADDNLLIVTSRMTDVEVDVEAQTARAEAGALWHHVITAAAPHGLAPLLGSSPHVGIIGYTLGGGIGWLARRYGLAADSVRSIEVVTPDGILRTASASENSDLFWGLLGGGGNFGVVTAMTFSLYPVKTIYGGNLMYPGERAAEALRFFRDWTKTLPDALTSSITIMKFPSLPFVPEPMRGKIQVIVRAAYTGDAVDGAALMQPWLEWQPPLANTFAEMPFSDIGTISNDPVDPVAGHGSHEMFNSLSDEAIDVLVQYATDPASPMTFSELRHAGGAISRVAADANAIGNRDAEFFLQLGALTPNEAAYNAVTAYIERLKNALRSHLRGGVYLNFMKGHESEHRVRDAYSPEAYERLLALKAKYDPENMFRYSYRIVPVENEGAH